MHIVCVAYTAEEGEQFQLVAAACVGSGSLHLCAGVAQTLSWLKQHTADMIFAYCRTDEQLKNAKQLAAHKPEVPLILLADDGKYALDAWQMEASGYLLIPYTARDLQRVMHKYKNQASLAHQVEIQTIPSFAVTIDGQPLHMSAPKPRELFALLVDCAQRGLSTAEGIALLWPDRDDDAKTRSLFRMTYKRLNSLLEEAGVSDIIASNNNKRYLQMDKVSCDLYQILDGDEEAQKRYAGLYMQEYSWAEDRNAQLYRMILLKN